MRAIALTTIGLSMILAGAASAADMAVKAPAASPVTAASWTGFYVGGEIGGRWTDSNWTTTCLAPGLAGVSCPAGGFPTRLTFNNPSNYNSSGAVGGVYGGYNWQITNWVVGVEGDFRWGDNKKTKAGIPGAEDPAAAASPGLDSSFVRQTWEASLRGRLGFLISPNILLFGTGGVAFTHAEASMFCGTAFVAGGWCTVANVGRTSTGSAELVGWTVGAGLEAMVAPNWLVRGEYRYADYGKMGSTLMQGPVTNLDAVAVDTSFRTHSAMVGVAYKFGGPVVAKY